MRDLRVAELLDLVTSDVSDPEDRLQRMYEWHFERTMTIAKIAIGAAGSITAALLIGLFKEEIKAAWWKVVLLVVGAILSAIYGVYRLHQLRAVHREYVASLKLYRTLLVTAPILHVYLRDADA